MSIRRETETALVRNCLDLLRVRGIFAWHNNTGAFVLGSGENRRFFRAGHVGSADIIGLLPPHGTLLAIEAKTGKNVQTGAQLAFEAAIRDSGGYYFLVRCLADLEQLLEEHGI